MTFHHADLADLKKAKMLLENPGLAARLSNYLGIPLEKGLELLPAPWHAKVAAVTQEALTTAINAAVFTMQEVPGGKASNSWHKIASATSGALGGLFGLPALAVELPISTTIMLRSISDIGRAQGENIHEIDAKMACLEVFCLGGRGRSDDASESAYFAIRALLAQSIAKASQHIAEKGLAAKGAPALVHFILKVSERFSVHVSQKLAMQAMPVIGAAGGALINSLFLDHFQDMAQGHFIVRRLERKYGQEMVEETYKTL